MLLLAGLTVAGCTASGAAADAGVGATAPSGPSVLSAPPLPELLPRVPVPDHSGQPVPPRLLPLVEGITAAIAGEGRVPPGVKVSQKAAAGEQVLVSWVVNTDPADPAARRNVRTDAVRILELVRASDLPYGSVLLAATGTVLIDGKQKVTRVVRAKYTRDLVQATVWAVVEPEIVFTLCDDKPAIISPTFR